MKLRFGWWNTGFVGGTELTEAQIAGVARVVRALIDDEQCSVIGLCEMTAASLRMLMGWLRLDGEWDVLVPRQRGEVSHDLVIAFDTRVVSAEQARLVPAEVGRHKICAGLVVELSLPTKDLLGLGLCHWPAIGMGDQDHVRRLQRQAAIMLGAALEVGSQRRFDHVLIAGDFNTEPFQSPMALLNGTRDIDQVRKRSDLLYNAAWRWLGARVPFDGHLRGATSSGTHFYRSGVESRWRTYDQVLASASLVEGVGWTLREDETAPWHGDSLRGRRGAYLDEQLDHLPLVVTLEYIHQAAAEVREDDG